MPKRFERREVTVLSTDMVGYSRMMAHDPDATVEARRYCEQTMREIAAAQNGRIFAYAGDGFLLEFGSETDAIAASLDVQATMRVHNKDVGPEQQVWLRAGIHNGVAIVEDENLHGDVVNIAVRLQESAP
ncbi:MAG: adenylate/guanylate cyclase domain-containing protein, partial [Pseudomonadota bacterium]|nr:adenylate/guanylate cyclase domain-containing protein [Pseudomonadota bacterium]